MKKFVMSLLASLFLISFLLPTSSVNAYSSINQVENKTDDPQVQFTHEEILTLEKYISVDENGFFQIDDQKALTDGVSEKLLKGQQNFLKHLNSEIDKGALKAEKNLEIEVVDSTLLSTPFSNLSSCPGKSTEPETHWWGYSRYFNNCEAIRFAADMDSVAAGFAAGGLLFSWFPPVGVSSGLTGVYAGLLSSRVTANNNGKGVFMEMTWALVFSITPQ